MINSIANQIVLLDTTSVAGGYQLIALPDFRVMVVAGKGTLSDIELKEFDHALKKFSDASNYDRFILMLPEEPSNAAFQLASYLETYLFKCAFILHTASRHHFKEKLFWFHCEHALAEIAFLDAIKMVGKFDVASVMEDEPADYSSFEELSDHDHV